MVLRGIMAKVVYADIQHNATIGNKVRRYNWHSAGSLDWPFLMIKY